MHFLVHRLNCKSKNPALFFKSICSTDKSSMSIIFAYCILNVSTMREPNRISNLQFLSVIMKRYNIEDINILMITFIMELANIGPTHRTVMEQLNANLAPNYHNYSFSDGAIILSIGEVNTSKPESHWDQDLFLCSPIVFKNPSSKIIFALNICVARPFP